jgi:hypothetical protein
MNIIAGSSFYIQKTIIDIDNVDIFVTYDGGYNWSTIALGVPINNYQVGNYQIYDPLNYLWVVPNNISNNCQFKFVGSGSNSDIISYSNYFSIVSPVVAATQTVYWYQFDFPSDAIVTAQAHRLPNVWAGGILVTPTLIPAVASGGQMTVSLLKGGSYIIRGVSNGLVFLSQTIRLVTNEDTKNLSDYFVNQ